MKKYDDAFGQYLYDCYKGKKNREIVERDDGYIAATDYFSDKYLANYKKWNKQEKLAIKFAKGKVLDIGCGAGRHAIYLQKEGLEVTGLDRSPLAIKVCKLRGLKKTALRSISEIDKFKAGYFNTILMLGNNLGLLGSYKKAKSLLKKMYKISSKNALIIAETLDPYVTKDKCHLAYHKRNKKRGRMPGQLRIRIRYNNLIGPWLDYLFVSKKELRGIVKETGWRIRKTINQERGRYFVILEKVKK